MNIPSLILTISMGLVKKIKMKKKNMGKDDDNAVK